MLWQQRYKYFVTNLLWFWFSLCPDKTYTDFFQTKKNVLLLFERGDDRIAFICSKSDKRYWRLIVFFAKSMKYIMMPFAKIFYHRPFWRIICLPNFWQSLHNKQHERNLQQSLFLLLLGCRIETFKIFPKFFSNCIILLATYFISYIKNLWNY